METFVTTTVIGTYYRLLPFKEEDISQSYIDWLNDPAVNRFLDVRFVSQTYETVLEYVRSFFGEQEKYMWGVYPKDTDVLIGTCSLHSIDKVHGTGETGYMIGEREHWGTSAGLEAMSLMMRFAFESLGLRRLVGGTYAKHHATNFNHKRLGYVCEGRLRKHHYWAPGVFVDVFRWGILAEEWEKRKDLES